MKAIRITVMGAERVKLGSFVGYLNADDDLAARLVSKEEVFIAASGECGLAYALAVASNRFKEYEIENIK